MDPIVLRYRAMCKRAQLFLNMLNQRTLLCSRRPIQHSRDLLSQDASTFDKIPKAEARSYSCKADESRGEEEGSTISMSYLSIDDLMAADHFVFIIIIPTPFNFFKRSLHRNHSSSYFVNIHIERLSHNENNSYPFIRPPKASIAAAAFTPPKALHINRNSPQKTTNHRPKPRTLPPLSEPPLPCSIRTYPPIQTLTIITPPMYSNQ